MPFLRHLLLAVPLWRQLRHLGGPGLILLGLVDNSVIPVTGSMDVLTIWLAARHREPWPYYAFMATLGAVIGGYITYALARKGGKETMERKLSKKKAAQFSKAFARWGFASIVIPALLPPPFPFLPFLVAAGAMQYSKRKFLGGTCPRSWSALFHRGLARIPLRPPHPAILRAILQTSDGSVDRLGSDRGGAIDRPVSPL